MVPNSRYYADMARGFSSNASMRVERDTSIYDTEFRKPEETVIAAGQYGPWSLVKSTMLKGIYTAKCPGKQSVPIGATRDTAAIAEFRALMRSMGITT